MKKVIISLSILINFSATFARNIEVKNKGTDYEFGTIYVESEIIDDSIESTIKWLKQACESQYGAKMYSHRGLQNIEIVVYDDEFKVSGSCLYSNMNLKDLP
jgi:hypothetical protein